MTMTEEWEKEFDKENWHAIEGADGFCACGIENGICHERLKTFIRKTIKQAQYEYGLKLLCGLCNASYLGDNQPFRHNDMTTNPKQKTFRERLEKIISPPIRIRYDNLETASIAIEETYKEIEQLVLDVIVEAQPNICKKCMGGKYYGIAQTAIDMYEIDLIDAVRGESYEEDK